MNDSLTIIVPMAGRGSRFSVAGFSDPKPLISIHGVPMIRLVIENIRPSRPHQFIFICQRDHVKSYDLATLLSRWAPGCSVIELDGVTEGAACTVLAARSMISAGPIMIANSDQYVDTSIDDYLAVQDEQMADGLIMTMRSSDPKWSFVGFDAIGRVTKVVEKQAISDEATVGIYNFLAGSDFVIAAEKMIAANKRVNDEFYVAPIYNELIASGARVVAKNIGDDTSGMYGLGTPADLAAFLALPLSRSAISRLL